MKEGKKPFVIVTMIWAVAATTIIIALSGLNQKEAMPPNEVPPMPVDIGAIEPVQSVVGKMQVYMEPVTTLIPPEYSESIQSAEGLPIETASAEADVRYPITNDERLQIEQVVMGEARGEPYEGQMMIAQCILDGMERNALGLSGYMKAYSVCGYSKEAPYQSVKDAVSQVFDTGNRVTTSKADIWYAYKGTKSPWHEAQQYVTTICCHKFFWCNRDVT